MAKKHGALDPDQDFLLVRARIKPSLKYVADVLEALYKGEIEGWERPIVDEDKSADYKYRTIVTPEEWKRYLCFEVDGIDYSSHVKEETVARQPEPKVANLYSALSRPGPRGRSCRTLLRTVGPTPPGLLGRTARTATTPRSSTRSRATSVTSAG
jgi:hypothetical protein